MIALTLKASFSQNSDPFVAILSRGEGSSSATLVGENDNELIFNFNELIFSITVGADSNVIGDVIFADPAAGVVQRWIRKDSKHNTLLITERCDQLCVMCSQPPKKSHRDYFVFFKQACLLAPLNIVIGLSGGEPLLYKNQLFALIEETLLQRPDLTFHVLTNAQHFSNEDLARLKSPLYKKVLWGVPLYSANSFLHDEIVGKSGAFDSLVSALSIMAQAGLNIELRTVLLKQNYAHLFSLAGFVADRLPFVRFWAIMQLERIGFAKNRWEAQFVDHSAEISILERSVSRVKCAGGEVALYNIPRCTVSARLRPYLKKSISDWKQKYSEACSSCTAKDSCGGFFIWHDSFTDYSQKEPL